jgi:hypothetical protein
MISINANTAEEIALALRGQGGEFDKILRAKQVADRLLGKTKDTQGTVVTAPRQSGKTTELLRYAEEKYPNGQFTVVCLNRYVQSSICHIYRDLRGDPSVSPPLMLTPDNLSSMSGRRVNPVFVDEWSLLPGNTIDKILNLGTFVAAVTS